MGGSAGELDREREEAVNQEEETTTTEQRGGDEIEQRGGDVTEQRGGGETSETVQGVDESSKLGAEDDGCEATPSAGTSEYPLFLLMDIIELDKNTSDDKRLLSHFIPISRNP